MSLNHGSRTSLCVAALLAGATLAQIHAEGGPKEILIHLPNPYAGGGPAAGNPGEQHRDQGVGSAGKPGGGGVSNGIDYHGGPVMQATVNIYYILYGTWDSTATGILTDFANGLGGSPYWKINATYNQGSSLNPVSSAVSYRGAVSDANYSRGKVNLSDADIQTIVATAISGGGLGAADPNGIYFVLTSSDVTKSGFCTSYCGWHTHATIAGTDIKYSFVGNPAQCINACAAQSTGPNGNAGVDGMISIIAHEASEAATDPDLNAWFDRRGYENADKCAWTFGTTFAAPNGALANVTLGSPLGARSYLIQRNWVNAGGGYCDLKNP